MKYPAMVLAGGIGTLRAFHPKLLEPITPQGTPMIAMTVKSVLDAGCDPCVVVIGKLYGGRIRAAINISFPRENIHFAEQEKRNGTGGAVRVALRTIPIEGPFLVVNGDMPCWKPETVQGILETHTSGNSMMTVGVIRVTRETPACIQKFARFERDDKGRICGIIERRTAGSEDRTVDLDDPKFVSANPALMVLDALWCRRVLPTLSKHFPKENRGDDTPEIYLTDLIKEAYGEGYSINEYLVSDHMEALGVNNADELQFLLSCLKNYQGVSDVEKSY